MNCEARKIARGLIITLLVVAVDFLMAFIVKTTKIPEDFFMLASFFVYLIARESVNIAVRSDLVKRYASIEDDCNCLSCVKRRGFIGQAFSAAKVIFYGIISCWVFIFFCFRMF